MGAAVVVVCGGAVVSIVVVSAVVSIGAVVSGAIVTGSVISIISYVGNRQMYGSWVNGLPSRFIQELPEDHIEAEADMGLYSPGRSSHWDSSGFDTKATTKQIIERSNKGSEYNMGDRVFHEKFGNGVIVHIDGQKLDINFDAAGQKRVMDSFITKA